MDLIPNHNDPNHNDPLIPNHNEMWNNAHAAVASAAAHYKEGDAIGGGRASRRRSYRKRRHARKSRKSRKSRN